jgi:hypothetical protein
MNLFDLELLTDAAERFAMTGSIHTPAEIERETNRLLAEFEIDPGFDQRSALEYWMVWRIVAGHLLFSVPKICN